MKKKSESNLKKVGPKHVSLCAVVVINYFGIETSI
jgi:hypothetical protein